MALYTESEFRQWSDTEDVSKLNPFQFTECSADAENDIIDLIDESALIDAKKSGSYDNAPRAAKVRLAHAKLTLRAVKLLKTNPVRQHGMIQTEHDGVAGNVNNSYVKFSEIEQERAALYDSAINDLKNYLKAEQAETVLLKPVRSKVVPVSVRW